MYLTTKMCVIKAKQRDTFQPNAPQEKPLKGIFIQMIHSTLAHVIRPVQR